MHFECSPKYCCSSYVCLWNSFSVLQCTSNNCLQYPAWFKRGKRPVAGLFVLHQVFEPVPTGDTVDVPTTDNIEDNVSVHKCIRSYPRLLEFMSASVAVGALHLCCSCLCSCSCDGYVPPAVCRYQPDTDLRAVCAGSSLEPSTCRRPGQHGPAHVRGSHQHQRHYLRRHRHMRNNLQLPHSQ